MKTPHVAAAPSAPPGRSRHERAPADPLGFPALLTKTEARTAVAEGHSNTAENPGRRHAHGHARRDERAAVRDERAADRTARTAVRAEGRAVARDEHVAARTPDAATPAAPGDSTTPPATPATNSTNVPGATAPEPASVPDPAAAGAVGGTAPAIADGSVAGAGGVPATVPEASGTTGTGADDLPGATPQDMSTMSLATATVPTTVPATGVIPDEPQAPVAAGTTTPDPMAGSGAAREAVEGGAATPQAPGEPTEGDAATPQASGEPTEGDAATPQAPGEPVEGGAATPQASGEPSEGDAATPQASGELTEGDVDPTGPQAPDEATDGDEPASSPAGRGRPAGGPILPDAASDRARAAVAAAHDGAPARAGGEAPRRDAIDAIPATVAAVPATAAQAPPPAAGIATTTTLPAAWTSRGLAQTVERLVDLVHVATARGVARAKLQLHPQELGGIEVRLRQSAAGLVASITAQRADGLEAVTQAGAELRRSLEERGLTLARLDISLATDGHGDRGWHGRQDRDSFPGRASGAVRGPAVEEIAEQTIAVEAPIVPTTPGAGVLVDVEA